MHILMYMDTVHHTHRHTQLADYETHLDVCKTYMTTRGPQATRAPNKRKNREGEDLALINITLSWR